MALVIVGCVTLVVWAAWVSFDLVMQRRARDRDVERANLHLELTNVVARENEQWLRTFVERQFEAQQETVERFTAVPELPAVEPVGLEDNRLDVDPANTADWVDFDAEFTRIAENGGMIGPRPTNLPSPWDGE